MARNKNNKQRKQKRNTPAIPTHPFIDSSPESSASKGSLRIMLNFTTGIQHSKNNFDTFFEILPKYAECAKKIYIGMIYRSNHGDEFTCKKTRRRVLAKVVKQINENFQPVKLHFVLHLRYVSLENIISGCEIYGLKFPNWTFDILTDDLQHVEHGSVIDRYLRKEYEKGACIALEMGESEIDLRNEDSLDFPSLSEFYASNKLNYLTRSNIGSRLGGIL